ncbi:hypothetical protein QQF64_030274 [Cirrhinus molitorella]|uniref:Uncharacterized protein n=1 Tax=Cirrhinus molitorella TaxID=172907 RepID=A0ABR3N2Z6_9TELE
MGLCGSRVPSACEPQTACEAKTVRPAQSSQISLNPTGSRPLRQQYPESLRTILRTSIFLHRTQLPTVCGLFPIRGSQSSACVRVRVLVSKCCQRKLQQVRVKKECAVL